MIDDSSYHLTRDFEYRIAEPYQAHGKVCYLPTRQLFTTDADEAKSIHEYAIREAKVPHMITAQWLPDEGETVDGTGRVRYCFHELLEVDPGKAVMVETPLAWLPQELEPLDKEWPE